MACALALGWGSACQVGSQAEAVPVSPVEVDDEGDTAARPGIQPELVSPSDGVVLSRPPWVTLAVRLPREALDARVELELDDQAWRDPLAVLRRRNARLGGGADYLATLPLLDLAPGEHKLRVAVTPEGGSPWLLESRFQYKPPPLALDIEVLDGAGRPVSARVAVWDKDGRYSLAGPDAWAVDPVGRDPLLASVFAVGGHARLRVEPGRYKLVAVRGVRDDVGVAELQVEQDTKVTLRVPEVVPTPGALSADLHVHTAASADAFVPDTPRFASLVAAGLDVVVMSDHGKVGDPTARLLALDPDARGIAGVEAAVRGRRSGEGHINVFPLTPGRALPKEAGLSALVAAWRQLGASEAGGRVVVQLNHPRGIQFRASAPPRPRAHGLFNNQGFDREVAPGQGSNAWMASPEGGALDIDAMEIVNRCSWPLYREVRLDWFALLDAGLAVTGTGNSDSHALAVEQVGVPVNLVEVGDAGFGGFQEALEAGRVSVSTGPVVSLEVRTPDGRSAKPGELLAASGPLTVIATVRAAPWVPVPELRLVQDGQVLSRQRLEAPPEGKALSHAQVWTAVARRDGWILVEAGPPAEEAQPKVEGLYAALFPGCVPLGFTNPVRLDAEGDGRWRPGGGS